MVPAMIKKKRSWMRYKRAKQAARYIVAKIIWVEMQKNTDINEPELDEKVKKDIELYKNYLRG